MYETFGKNSAIAMLPIIRIAAQTIQVKGIFSPSEIKGALKHLACSTQRLNSWRFNNEEHRKGEIRLVAMLALADSNMGIEDSIRDTEVKGSASISMTAEEMAAWCQKSAVKELMVLADQRHETWRKLYEFANNDRKIIVGKYRDIDVFFETRLAWKVDLPSNEEIEQAMTLAKLYIDAAFSLAPDFQSAGFNAGYGENNLSYLAQEWYENNQLYRVFVPFLPPTEGLQEIEEAKEVALLRSELELSDEPAYPWTPEVGRLLEAADWEPDKTDLRDCDSAYCDRCSQIKLGADLNQFVRSDGKIVMLCQECYDYEDALMVSGEDPATYSPLDCAACMVRLMNPEASTRPACYHRADICEAP